MMSNNSNSKYKKPFTNSRSIIYLPDDGTPIDNLKPISKGFYGYSQDGYKRQTHKHVVRAYTDAMHMVKHIINQFETLEASVAQLPEAALFMNKNIHKLKTMLKSIEREHNNTNNILFGLNQEANKRKRGRKPSSINSNSNSAAEPDQTLKFETTL